MSSEEHNKAAVIDRLLKKFSRGQENFGFGEAYDLLEELDAALKEVKDEPALCGRLSAVRDQVTERMEVRARELGMSDETSCASGAPPSMKMGFRG